jgi:hypothetical protein
MTTSVDKGEVKSGTQLIDACCTRAGNKSRVVDGHRCMRDVVGNAVMNAVGNAQAAQNCALLSGAALAVSAANSICRPKEPTRL